MKLLSILSITTKRVLLVTCCTIFFSVNVFAQPDTSYYDTVSSKIYRVMEFTSVGSQTHQLPCHVDEVEVLVVAGGGSGGTSLSFSNAGSGGGGAGGVVYKSSYKIISHDISIEVGAGGIAPTSGNTTGRNGGNSVFGNLIAIGGGGGIGGNGRGRDGGSGGGSRGNSGGSALQSSSASGGFGNSGGNSGGSPGGAAATGGGGAGAAAANLSGSNGEAGTDGGAGLQFDITGSQIYYAGGGAGGAAQANVPGSGGLGGGGNGANDTIPSTPGINGLGGGGGGGNNNQRGSNGGSGIVIVKYEIELGGLTWTGASNNDWNNTANWDSAAVPQKNTPVILPTGLGTYPEITGDYSASEIEIQAGAELLIKSTGDLTVHCHITNNGTITVENKGALIQRGTADNNTGTGTYIIEREGKSASNAFNVWSSPVPGLAVHDDALVGSYDAVFSDANPCDIFVFDASKQNWSHDFAPNYEDTCNGTPVTFTSNFLISGADGILTTARGYFVPGATPATRTFEGGSIHNGDITKNLQSGTNPGSSNINWAADNWNLIGNPYPSAIDVERFLDFNGSELITQAVYVWDDRETGVYDEADYITVNASGSTSGGGNNNITNGNIASCQGFAVQGTGTITFTNAMREGGNDQFRSGSDFGQNPNTRMWLSVSDDTRQSEMLIALVPGTTRGFDKKYDAPKNYGQQNLNIAAQLPGGEDMAIYAESPLTGINEERKIPLTFQTANTDEVKFAINRSDQMPENLEVILVDEVAGVETDLLVEENYTFNPDTAGNYRNRFYLKLANKLTVAEDPVDDESGVTGVEESREEIEVKTWARQNDIVVESRGVQLKSVELIDVSGRTLAIQRATSTNRILMETSGLSSGVYMVRSLDTDGAIRVNKIMLSR